MTNYVTVLIHYDTLFDGHIYNAFKNKYLNNISRTSNDIQGPKVTIQYFANNIQDPKVTIKYFKHYKYFDSKRRFIKTIKMLLGVTGLFFILPKY